MSWSGNVLGGVGAPRFFLLSDDLITNGSFEDDDDSDSIPDNWTAGNSAVLQQTQDLTTIFGDYVMDLEDNAIGSAQYAQQTGLTLPSGNLSSAKKLLVVMYVKFISGTTDTITIEIIDNDSILAASSQQTGLITGWRLYWFYISTLPSSAASPNFTIRVYPNDGVASALGNYYFDNLQCYEVESVYTLPQPNEWRNQGFDRELQTGRQRLIDGTLKEYVDGWRYRAELLYEYMGVSDETSRQAIAEHDGLIGFQPHMDVDWGQVCHWNGNLEREYFFNRYLAHSSTVPMIGAELLSTPLPYRT